MAVQRVTTVSWFDRIKNSFGGIFGGILIILGMVLFLFWNEGSAVREHKSLTEGAGVVVSVSADQIDTANEGRLVHLSGPVTTEALLSDEDFGITSNALRLERKVEMFQWVETSKTETKKNLGGSETHVTTFSYALDWSATEQDSSRFEDRAGHENPRMALKARKIVSDHASLGAYSLDRNVLERLGGATEMRISTAQSDDIQRAVGEGKNVSVIDGMIYLGADPSLPQPGDYRIRYHMIPEGTFSIIAQQQGNGLVSYQTQAGNTIFLIQSGVASYVEMFAGAVRNNTIMTWIFRISGLTFLVVGCYTLLRPIAVLSSIIPFFGSIVSTGLGMIAVTLGLAVGTVTIASAWLFYRPLTALFILVVGAVGMFVVRYLMGRHGKAQPKTEVAA